MSAVYSSPPLHYTSSSSEQNITHFIKTTIIFRINIENIDPDPRNIQIVFVVQKYILVTKRFQSAAPPPFPNLPKSPSNMIF